MKPRRVAIVGGGIAGMAAALDLVRHHDVTLFERERALGGHANGVLVDDGDGRTLEVDTAFLIFNDGTYPRFMELIDRLGVRDAVRETEMSSSYHDAKRGFFYALGKGARNVLAQPTNALRASFRRLLWDIARFRRTPHERLDAWSRSDLSLGALFERERYSRAFVTDFACPMGGAIWSLPPGAMLDFPAATFLRFFANHRQVRATSRTAPRWLTFEGSSRRYVRAFARAFTASGHGKVEHARVRGIVRDAAGVTLRMDDGALHRFDDVVLATHADEALDLLAEPTDDERRCLGAWRYHPTVATLHTDATGMPPRPSLWSSWNMAYDAADLGRGARVTYHLNTVQRLDAKRDYFLSLGDDLPIERANVLETFAYAHPIFSAEAIATQRSLPQLNGHRHTYFCGSYFGFGFHEDAVRSAADVALHFLPRGPR